MNILEKFYFFLYQRKKFNSLRKQKKLPFPVASVGNLTLGGTGKTPFALELAMASKARGFKPIVLTRGYKGKLKGPVMVSSEHKTIDVGDEPLVMVSERIRVFKGIDRYETGIFAIEKLNLTEKDKAFFILDDGFQHWRLHRDLDILLIDGMKGFGNYRLFPLGPLRSPLQEISLADMVFITKKENDELRKELIKYGAKSIYYAPFKITALKDNEGNTLDAKGKTAFVFAGIGNFEYFLEILRKIDIKILNYRKFIDHKNYTKKTIQKLIKNGKNADIFITTKKDFIKLKKYIKIFNGKLHYLQISMEIPAEAMDKIFNLLELFYSTSS
jgi:tetraacyldisaccharide 4'-kinase